MLAEVRVAAEPRLRLEQAAASSTSRRQASPPVILASTFYMTNVLAAAEPIREHGILPAPAGDGAVAMIDPRDIASVEAAVSRPRSRGADLPADRSGADRVRADRGAALRGRVRGHVPPEGGAPGNSRTPPCGAWLVDHLDGAFALIRSGAMAETTDVVRAIADRDPRDFAAFAGDHAALLGRLASAHRRIEHREHAGRRAPASAPRARGRAPARGGRARRARRRSRRSGARRGRAPRAPRRGTRRGPPRRAPRCGAGRLDHLRRAVDGREAPPSSRSHTSVAATPCPQPISSTRSAGRTPSPSTIRCSRSLTLRSIVRTPRSGVQTVDHELRCAPRRGRRSRPRAGRAGTGARAGALARR